jgi:hypothetical protein
MSMERFTAIVDAAKEQELELKGQAQLIEQLEKQLEGTQKKYEILAKINRIKGDHQGGIVIEENKFGDRPRKNVEDIKWDNLTMGIVGLTSKPDLKGKIMAKVHFVHPLTGRDTTKSSVQPTLIDAIIARNDIAATLLKDGLINLEQFKKYTVI